MKIQKHSLEHTKVWTRITILKRRITRKHRALKARLLKTTKIMGKLVSLSSRTTRFVRIENNRLAIDLSEDVSQETVNLNTYKAIQLLKKFDKDYKESPFENTEEYYLIDRDEQIRKSKGSFRNLRECSNDAAEISSDSDDAPLLPITDEHFSIPDKDKARTNVINALKEYGEASVDNKEEATTHKEFVNNIVDLIEES